MKIKITFLIVSLIACGCWAAPNTIDGIELPKAKMTVRVVDENGQPIKDAEATFYFMNSSFKSATDVNGIATGETNCDLHWLGCNIKRKGYYSGGPADVKPHPDLNTNLNRWEPWNETNTVILRLIGKPVALYARTVKTEIPALNQPCGFDLEAGDWVAPYGKGKERDFVFTMQKSEVKDGQNFDTQGELTFSSPLDGLEPAPQPLAGRYSMFRWERQAPENGYNSNYRLYRTWWQSKNQRPIQNFDWDFAGELKGWEGYFFRVRTLEQDGKIINANYGKILGGIMVWPDSKSGKPKVSFTYYFNPSQNDRNLEWDTKRNLFSGLSNDETPHPSWWL